MTEVEEQGDAAFKAFEPLFPCQNKKIQESLDKTTFSRHRQAVNQASTVLDTKQPRVYIHQHLKLKKLQLEEERLATIERDNRLLLERIAKIMRTTGSIDNNNLNRDVKSLSIERRQRELLRITNENKQILGRIMNRKTTSQYSRENWEPKWRKEEYYMAQLSRFQPVSSKTKKSEEKGEENAQPENDGDQQQQTTDRKSQKTKKESKQQEKA
ncbi:uncharacterized protein LOC134852488 [Symsagittifera roscoffensis]|uniref:uncharacterized protein LOC134852488 n=1 Tax=Symsagittifera roscoffensis TaxID=84072 RepID=UPI00307B273D